MKRKIRIEVKAGEEISLLEAKKIIANGVDIIIACSKLSKSVRSEFERASVFIWDRVSEEFFKQPGA